MLLEMDFAPSAEGRLTPPRYMIARVVCLSELKHSNREREKEIAAHHFMEADEIKEATASVSGPRANAPGRSINGAVSAN